MESGWEFWIDRGGTFTDVVARDPEGAIHVHKLLSENPDHYEDAPLEAMRRLLELGQGAPFPPGLIRSVRMGTTLATNALLERKGVPVGLLITKGFRDLLEIGYQDRPNLFALNIEKPESLAKCIIEIDERVLADGEVRAPLNDDEVRAALQSFRDDGIDSVAVLFLHSYAHPDHEKRVGEMAQAMGFSQISLSHQVACEIKAVPRGDTTLVDAYLTPILRDYVARIRKALGPDVILRFMRSDGGLVRAENFSGKDAILSGPAGGVVATYNLGLTLEKPQIGFDMGGTSTDVSRIELGPTIVHETRVAGVRLKAPMIEIETVAAGGGSILGFEHGRLTVGPASAGANPGPACYGKGGPATVTDANLILGRIAPGYMPRTFGPNADAPLSRDAAHSSIGALRDPIQDYTQREWSLEEVAEGYLRIANEHMVSAIKTISVARGYDVQEHVLVCFGGAGGQHACAIADALGINTIRFSPYAGVFSAYGMGRADIGDFFVKPILTELNSQSLLNFFSQAEESKEVVYTRLAPDIVSDTHIDQNTWIELRYVGSDSSITFNVEEHRECPGIIGKFESLHRREYSFTHEGRAIEIVNMRIHSYICTGGDENPRDFIDSERTKHETIDTPGQISSYAYARLAPEVLTSGPALIHMDTSVVVVESGWSFNVDSGCHELELIRETVKSEIIPRCTTRDPIMLEVFNNLFMSIADQMGKRLEHVAHSVNIKERLDFSCALFTADGELVANAHHIPVHLGAMGESVKAVLRARGDSMSPGDVFATNDPFDGGSHLPDITVVTPVFDDAGDRIFIVANRGHHADIGGITPGSMPPNSKTIDEEGIVLRNVPIVHGGHFDEEGIINILSSGPHPARNIDERLSDLRAQIAANTFGVELLQELVEKYSLEVVQAYMNHMRDNAAECMESVLRELGDGEYSFEDAMDDGAIIAVKITIRDGRATIDFTGTSPQVEGNLNAPRAVTVSACLYVLRSLIAKDIPLNSGCLSPIDIIIPEGSLLNPNPPAAVVGGNVETSQRICDVLYGALESVAASQGTMNNLTFGNESWGYYETICGGTGAGPDFDGTSAVHSHMTNTRITDPEVMEHRYPVVVRSFTVREGSGGAGARRGGDGIVREIEFREPVEVSMISERRTRSPYGLKGGASGAPGQNTFIGAEGESQTLEGHFTLTAKPGDAIRIESPGGGGYGSGSIL